MYTLSSKCTCLHNVSKTKLYKIWMTKCAKKSKLAIVARDSFCAHVLLVGDEPMTTRWDLRQRWHKRRQWSFIIDLRHRRRNTTKKMMSPVVVRRILPPLAALQVNKDFFFLHKNTNKTKEFKALTVDIFGVPFSASLTTKTSSAAVVSALKKIPETSNTCSLKIYSKYTNVGALTAVLLFPTPVAYPRHPSPSNFLRFSLAGIRRRLDSSSSSNFLRIGWLVI